MTVVPSGSPPSSVISSPLAPKVRRTKQSSLVVVADGQVGVEELKLSDELIFIGLEVSLPVIRTIKPYPVLGVPKVKV